MSDSDNNPEPMIKLEPNGSAPVISYNVPEPTSYSGRNFTDLQLGASYFKTTTPAGSSSLTTSSATAASGPDATDALATLIMEAAASGAPAGNGETALTARSASAVDDSADFDLPSLLAGLRASGMEVSDKLVNLDLNEVRAMRRLGKRLNIYRTMFGTLGYNYVDEPKPVFEAETKRLAAARSGAFAPRAVSTTVGDGGIETDPIYAPVGGDSEREPISTMRDEEGGGGGGGGTTPTVSLSVRIDAPAAGSTLNGPHGGMSFTITGVSGVVSGGGSISKVEVQVGSGEWKIASQTGPTLATWAILGNVNAAGPLTITARATHSAGKTTTHAVNVNVALAPPPDTSAPGLNITFPTEGQELPGNSTGAATVSVAGTASDIQSGVQTVELKLDGGAYTQVSPGNPDWSSWTKVVNIPAAGNHTLTARCTDKAGNVTTKTVSLRVTAAPPPDTLPPSVNISAPAQNASVAGPFNGASVTVRGTASDASGIRTVEVLVDGAVTQAQPKAAGDWSEWSATVIIKQTGLRTITARCSDGVGNTNTSTVAVNVTLIPDVVSRLNRLILVESYRLSSYLGGYGAGRTIKTFSLLPGEKTKISIKTYTKTEADFKSASSILDSFTQESSDDFERSMGKEQSNKKNYDESFNYKVDATASASWGWGSASVSGGVSGGTNSAREEFAKNISNATQKHAARASAKRDVQINTSYEVKESSGEETSVERLIENINVSRTLNFVFRQMNQEFITVLHLVDVRVGFFKVVEVQGVPQYTYKEVTLPELDALLEEVIVPAKRAEVRADIVHQLSNIFDYKDRRHQFVQEEPMRDHNGQAIPLSQYLRVRKDYTSTYLDEATGTQIKVPGIILDANKYVLRTEGVIVEALLGQGDALDAYSHGLQDAAVREKNLANDRARAEVRKAQLALQIIEAGDAEKAKLFAQLNPQPAAAAQLVPYVLAPKESTNGQPVN